VSEREPCRTKQAAAAPRRLTPLPSDLGAANNPGAPAPKGAARANHDCGGLFCPWATLPSDPRRWCWLRRQCPAVVASGIGIASYRAARRPPNAPQPFPQLPGRAPQLAALKWTKRSLLLLPCASRIWS